MKVFISRGNSRLVRRIVWLQIGVIHSFGTELGIPDVRTNTPRHDVLDRGDQVEERMRCKLEAKGRKNTNGSNEQLTPAYR